VSVNDDVLEQLRRAIEELASSEAAELVQEARLEARVKVRSMLAEAIGETLLERAGEQLAQEAPSREGRPEAQRSGAARAAGKTRATDGVAARATGEAETREARPVGDTPSGQTPAPPAVRAQTVADTDANDAAVGLYVYGVVDGEDRDLPELIGIDGVHPITAVFAAGIGAVVSQVALSEFGEDSLHEHVEDLSWLEEHAYRHEFILDKVREQRTLVPMRLCTIYATEDAVREMLEREHAFLADGLERLARRTEWGVKLFLREGALERAEDDEVTSLGESAQGLADARPGERYLLGRRMKHLRDQEHARMIEECCEEAHARLGGLAVEARMNPLQPRELSNHEGHMLLNGVYLVDDVASEEFSALVADLREEFDPRGLDVELTGPWPPYNFVNSSRELGR
jgi:hypothetical protein